MAIKEDDGKGEAQKHPIVERPEQRDFDRRQDRNLQSLGLMRWAAARMDPYAMSKAVSKEMDEIDTRLGQLYSVVENFTLDQWIAEIKKPAPAPAPKEE